MNYPTQKRLKELFRYDPEAGNFLRINSVNKHKAGAIAGCIGANGYKVVMVDGKRYYLHRLIFIYMTGSLPSGVCDHKNRDQLDNRWCNLRDITKQENCQNSFNSKKTSGLFGTCFDKSRGKWLAVIRHEKKYKNLGRFDTEEEAHRVFMVAKAAMHPSFSGV